MHDKDLRVVEYLDLYGEILEERQRQIVDMYFNDDYSLAEISEITGITRQGVSESVRKSVKKLHEIDEKLHLKDRIESFERNRDVLTEKIRSMLKNDDSPEDSTLAQLIADIGKLSI